jgi:hypothetical protein
MMEWKETFEVQTARFDDKVFYFVDVGKEIHGKKSFRLWINRKLVPQPDKDGIIKMNFPIVGVKVIKTEKGNYVLRPQQGWWTSIFIKYSGYRGISKCEILSPKDIISIPYKIFESPQGNLGISEGLLFSAPESEVVIIEWKRTGRLYGSEPKGTARLFPNGVIEEISLRAEELSEIEKYL